MYPTDRLYSRDHEWIRIEGDVGTVGITTFAQDELGEVVYVELPEVGQSYDTGEEIGTIESVKAVAEVYTPVSGEVIAANEVLDSEPDLINSSPHDDGWLFKIRLEGEADLDSLMDAGGYQRFLEEETS